MSEAQIQHIVETESAKIDSEWAELNNARFIPKFPIIEF